MKAIDPRISRSTVHPFPTTELFGLSFLNAPDEAHVAEHLLTSGSDCQSTGHDPILVTPNVDIIVQLERSKARGLRDRLANCAYVLPDGAPIVWASRWVGTPLKARIAGSNLFSHWWPTVAAERRSVVVLCSNEAVKTGLEKEHPDAVVIVAPLIDTSDVQINRVADQLIKAALEIDAEFCALCIGHPKDPLISVAFVDRWPGTRPLPLLLCLGASAEFHVGLKRRAPDWAQRNGLEWLIRFMQEPRRMFHRYFVRDLGFFPMVFREVVGRRRS